MAGLGSSLGGRTPHFLDIKYQNIGKTGRTKPGYGELLDKTREGVRKLWLESRVSGIQALPITLCAEAIVGTRSLEMMRIDKYIYRICYGRKGTTTALFCHFA
jgi:hypothetical protein